MAHEIGNPLNSLTIHLQLLEREAAQLDAETRDDLLELVRVARQEVTRLDQIITQFLRALRPTTPQREPASLREVLDDTLNFLQHEIRDRDVLVEVDAPEALPTCYIDKAQIKQAFFNVIRNAIQAMPDGGLLKIDLSADERFVGIAFKDTGPGIAAEDIGRIFEPYHTTKEEGTGLGLMIVQRIVRDHGGRDRGAQRAGLGHHVRAVPAAGRAAHPPAARRRGRRKTRRRRRSHDREARRADRGRREEHPRGAGPRAARPVRGPAGRAGGPGPGHAGRTPASTSC